MNEALLLVVLLVAVAAGGVLAKRLDTPYPIVFVIGGVALAFIPNLPVWHLDPNLIFLIVLPPLLFAGGWTTDWYAFKDAFRPIAFLAIGLVLVTTLVVAWIAHQFVGLSWPMAFALGAIVGPTDPVAAEAVFERFSVPKRITTILYGEGLVNDASALVVYRFAVTAAVLGTFSLRQAAVSFVLVVAGGIATGMLCGFVVKTVLKILRKRDLYDSTLATVMILLAPYAAYLPAEAVHVSGVLAAVTAGIYLSRRTNDILDAEGRVVGVSVWNVMTFLLNAFVFLAIGLQLRPLLGAMQQHPGRFAFDAAVVCVAVIVLRFAWSFTATPLTRLLFRGVRKREPQPSWRALVLIGFTGMRGIVSLSAALALPYRTSSGAPLSGRADVIIITVAVIFVTLVGSGATLAAVVNWLRIGESSESQKRNADVRIRALEAGLRRLHSLEPGFDSALEWETAGRLLREYEDRIEHLRGHLHADSEEEPLESSIDHHLQREALDAEREEIRRLRMAGEIPDDVYREIEKDLDLANLRLA